MSAIPSRVLASCFALVCFAAAVLVGLAAGNPLITVLWRALLVMGGAWLIGLAVGMVFQRVLDQHIEQYRSQVPMPDEDEHEQSSESGDVEVVEAAEADAQQTQQAA